MKPAYDVPVWNFNDCCWLYWQNYAYGKESLRANNEKEAFEKLAAEGWEVKNILKRIDDRA